MNIKQTLTCNLILVLIVDNISFTIDTPLYSICEKWIFIKCLHLDNLKYEFCTHNNKYNNEQMWIYWMFVFAVANAVFLIVVSLF
jgi:hypothetical protein